MSRSNDTTRSALERHANRLLRAKVVALLLGVSIATFYRMLNAGDFPAGIQVTQNTVAWRLATVDEWIDERVMCSEKEGK